MKKVLIILMAVAFLTVSCKQGDTVKSDVATSTPVVATSTEKVDVKKDAKAIVVKVAKDAKVKK